MLRSGAAALGGTSALLAGTAASAQNPTPAVVTGTQTGRTFRGLVRHDTTLDVQELRLLPIDRSLAGGLGPPALMIRHK